MPKTYQIKEKQDGFSITLHWPQLDSYVILNEDLDIIMEIDLEKLFIDYSDPDYIILKGYIDDKYIILLYVDEDYRVAKNIEPNSEIGEENSFLVKDLPSLPEKYKEK